MAEMVGNNVVGLHFELDDASAVVSDLLDKAAPHWKALDQEEA